MRRDFGEQSSIKSEHSDGVLPSLPEDDDGNAIRVPDWREEPASAHGWRQEVHGDAEHHFKRHGGVSLLDRI